jgi:hypothetical protein
MKANPPPQPIPVRPLISAEQMERILSARRSIFSEEFRLQVANHFGRPPAPGRRKSSVNEQTVWVCCQNWRITFRISFEVIRNVMNFGT